MPDPDHPDRFKAPGIDHDLLQLLLDRLTGAAAGTWTAQPTG